jgi:uncharacterized surface protein with fasciclin (FAS1) repeats
VKASVVASSNRRGINFLCVYYCSHTQAPKSLIISHCIKRIIHEKINLLLTLSLASFFIISSCSPGSEEAAAATATTTSSTTSPTGQSGVKDDESVKNVIQVASGSKDHSTLVAAVKAAGLVEALSNAGPFTVFAPTNSAFDKLPAGTGDNLLKPENKDQLADILQYHVSIGVYKEDMLQDGQSLGQANSGNITINKKDGKIIVNGSANVIGSVQASNGIIYIIDGVLIPPVNK